MTDDELLESAIKKQNTRAELYTKLDDGMILNLLKKQQNAIEACKLGLIDVEVKNTIKRDLKARVHVARIYRYKIVFDGEPREFFDITKELRLTKEENDLYWEWWETQK